MTFENFAQQTQALRRRVADLYQRAALASAEDLLACAFDELQHGLEQLQFAEDALRLQQQEIAVAKAACEQERLSTADVFNGVPAPYVITGVDGTIRRLNRAAMAFFNQTERFLLGKSLGLFVPEGERRAFRACLEDLRGLTNAAEQRLRLQPHDGRPLHVTLKVGSMRDRAGRTVALHWLISDSARRRSTDGAHLSERFV